MPDDSKKRNEYSEELRALALRFFSFTEKFRSDRTQEYMEYSMILKMELEHIQEMLDAMKGCKSFNKFNEPTYPEGKTSFSFSGGAIKHVRQHLNAYSSETLFEDIKNDALRKAVWYKNPGNMPGGVPDAEASAWLAYFTDWDEEKKMGYGRRGDHVPNENWHEYYREYFGSRVDEDPKPKRRSRKTKKS